MQYYFDCIIVKVFFGGVDNIIQQKKKCTSAFSNDYVPEWHYYKIIIIITFQNDLGDCLFYFYFFPAVIHPFAEHIAYFVLCTLPLLGTLFTRTASIASFAGYITFIDFMNNLGHCNYELIPKWLFSIFPPLKYLMYTPS